MLIRHLFEGSNYESMIQTLAPLGSNIVDRARQDLAKTRKYLHRNDQVVWWFRWYRYRVLEVLFINMERMGFEGDERAAAEKLFKSVKDDFARHGIAPKKSDTMHFFGALTQENTLTHIAHFLALPIPEIKNFRFGWETWPSIHERFKDIEAEWKRNRVGTVVPREGDQMVLEVSPGVAWWMLNRGSCTDEAEAMGHCGNEGSAEPGDRILSLRREIRKGDVRVYSPDLTFILAANGFLGEMKGRGNDKPAPRYHAAIVALLKTPLIKGIGGGGYLPEHNFKVTDLSEELQNDLYAVRPDLMPLTVCFAREKGATPAFRDLLTRRINERITSLSTDLAPQTARTVYDEHTNRVRIASFSDIKNFAAHWVSYESGFGNGTANCVFVKKIIENEGRSDHSFDLYRGAVRDIMSDVEDYYPKEFPGIARKIIAMAKRHQDFDGHVDMSSQGIADTAFELGFLDPFFRAAMKAAKEKGAVQSMKHVFSNWLMKPTSHEDAIIQRIILRDTPDGFFVEVSLRDDLLALLDESEDLHMSSLVLVDDIQEPVGGWWSDWNSRAAADAFVENWSSSV